MVKFFFSFHFFLFFSPSTFRMSQLVVKQYKDADEFLQETRETLLLQEALNTFVIMTADQLQTSKADPSTYHCNATWDGTELVMATLSLSGQGLYLSSLFKPSKQEAVELLAKDAYASGIEIGHLHGYDPILGQVKDILKVESGNKWEYVVKESWSYVIDKVKWSKRDLELLKSGKLRLATKEDLPLVEEMTLKFSKDTGDIGIFTEEQLRSSAKHHIEIEHAYLWETDQDGPVAMVWRRRPLVKGCSIGYVYVFPEHRHKGYASVMVASFTEELLKNYEFGALFALLEQDVNDNLYTRLGCRYIGRAGYIKIKK